MRIKLTRTLVGASTEWTLEVDRGQPRLPRGRELLLASQCEERFRMALEAIERAPESAGEIAEEALHG